MSKTNWFAQFRDDHVLQVQNTQSLELPVSEPARMQNDGKYEQSAFCVLTLAPQLGQAAFCPLAIEHEEDSSCEPWSETLPGFEIEMVLENDHLVADTRTPESGPTKSWKNETYYTRILQKKWKRLATNVACHRFQLLDTLWLFTPLGPERSSKSRPNLGWLMRIEVSESKRLTCTEA